MQNSNRPPAAPPSRQLHSLSQDVLDELLHGLSQALPPPPAGGDEQQERALQEQAAIAAVMALCPVTAAEGRLAAQFVVADAWATECLRQALAQADDLADAARWRRQAVSMMQEGRDAMNLLLQLQADRRRWMANATAASPAARVGHAARRWMH